MRSRIEIPLSKLHPGPQNPRRTKPGAEAHRRMVASIRAFKLLQPLLVRPMADQEGEYEVIAGGRRLAALKEIHRDAKDDPKVACELRDVDDDTAEAMSLTENFVRAAMSPMDEAEAFARLATDEAEDVEELAAMFGTTERFVRQRMKLAGLAKVIKTALRQNEIDIAIAEAFTAVPESRQAEIWKELNGHPAHAQHVRNIIQSAWIDSSNALFDLSMLPPEAVSRDLFGDRVLVERKAFMDAQAEALVKEQQELLESGWSNVITGGRDQVPGELYSMEAAPLQLDAKTQRKLNRLEERLNKQQLRLESLGEDDTDAAEPIETKIQAIEQAAQNLVDAAPVTFAEETKAVGTVFLLIAPDGQVQREYRVPRAKRAASSSSRDNGHVDGAGVRSTPAPPTSNDLSDSQKADTYSHQVLMVREALLKAPTVRKRLLAMILHDTLCSEALAVRHDPNAVTLHASHEQPFTSTAYEHLVRRRKELDPFSEERHIDDQGAFARLMDLPDGKVQHLIDLLVVETLTTHLHRGTVLVASLAKVLEVDIRRFWRPDTAWLNHFQKCQLSHLLAQFRGPTYSPAHETRKKTELVAVLEKLFTDAAEGQLEDKALAERVNAWLPSNLREINGDRNDTDADGVEESAAEVVAK
jgi:ParB family transcriptional regulator, chromosome partitioning protein